ncbi:MAG TPA: RNA polymerase sigma factor SigI [Streptosporangiaceae bacterium]|nr:RNA polymerase sigma factor SigI [Streptosporangiaceae bacterium]
MAGKQDDATISQAYREHRPYLVDLAFRMLGDLGAAEDVVQDAFARLLRAGTGEIDDERGWLIVVTSRLALDQIRSARSRRERAHDPGEIGFAPPQAQPALADPADRITFDDSVRLALLVMLQKLSPAERVVFVLHDVFGMPFDTIAQTVGRPSVSCRQLARRARQKIADGAPGARFDVESAEHRLVTDKFIAACARGDLDGLVAVLAPDAWGDIDLGPAAEPRPVVTGAENVAANLLRFWGPGSTLVSHPAGGQPALLGFHGRALAALLVLRMCGEQVEAVHVIADPAQIGFLGRHLAASAR